VERMKESRQRRETEVGRQRQKWERVINKIH
jgi:hypothetical protein